MGWFSDTFKDVKETVKGGISLNPKDHIDAAKNLHDDMERAGMSGAQLSGVSGGVMRDFVGQPLEWLGLGGTYDSLNKEYDRFMASDKAKVVAAAVAIYTAGSSMGWWGNGSAAASGSSLSAGEWAAMEEGMAANLGVGSAAELGTVTTAAETGAMGGSSLYGAGTEAAAVAIPEASPVVEQVGTSPEMVNAQESMTPGTGVTGGSPAGDLAHGDAIQSGRTASNPWGSTPRVMEAGGGGAQTMAEAAGFGGKMSTAAKTIGSFIKENPMASALMAQTVAGAFTADEMDMARAQAKMQEEAMQRRRDSFEMPTSFTRVKDGVPQGQTAASTKPQAPASSPVLSRKLSDHTDMPGIPGRSHIVTKAIGDR